MQVVGVSPSLARAETGGEKTEEPASGWRSCAPTWSLAQNGTQQMFVGETNEPTSENIGKMRALTTSVNLPSVEEAR